MASRSCGVPTYDTVQALPEKDLSRTPFDPPGARGFRDFPEGDRIRVHPLADPGAQELERMALPSFLPGRAFRLRPLPHLAPQEIAFRLQLPGLPRGGTQRREEAPGLPDLRDRGFQYPGLVHGGRPQLAQGFTRPAAERKRPLYGDQRRGLRVFVVPGAAPTSGSP